MEMIGKMMTRIATAAAAIAAAIMILMIGHILLEIVLRSFFDSSTYVLDEFVGYAVASMTFLTLAYALNDGSLIRVNLVLGRLNRKSRRAVEVGSSSLAFVVFLYILFFFFRSWIRNWDRGTVSGSIAEVPLWIPEGIVLIGLTIFVLQLFVYSLRTFMGGPLIKVRSE